MTLLAAAALSTLTAAAAPVEVGVQLVAALAADERTRAGGGGLGVEVAVPVADFTPSGLRLLLRARASALAGVGLAYAGELGAALSARRFSRWQPDAGLYVMYMAGDIVRTADQNGRLATNPLALQAGINALRFELTSGWVALVAVRAGPILNHPGPPRLALSLTLVEVGQSF